MDITILIILLISHWVGDFLLQKEEWAVTKHNNFANLQKHSITYALSVGAFIAVWMLFPMDFKLIPLLLFILVTSITHTMVDFITSKINHRLYRQNKMRAFYKVIGLDQLAHYIILILTFNAII